MREAIKALLAVDDGVDANSVRALLPDESQIDVIGVAEGSDSSWLAVNDQQAGVLFFACEEQSDRALSVIAHAVEQRPDRPVVVLCIGSANGFVRQAFAAGADDLLTIDSPQADSMQPELSAEILFATQKALARKSGLRNTAETKLGRMICVLGPKGGVGKTLTTCNLGVTLASHGYRVVIVDLDLQFGDVGLSLRLNPHRTIYDLATSSGSLDAGKIEDYLEPHESGVRALLAPMRPDQARAVTPEFLRDLYPVLRASNDFVIVDTPPGFTPEVIASIDASSDACMVGMLDSLSLKNTKLGLETLDLMGYDSRWVRVVLNRAGTRVGVSHDDVAAIIGRVPDVFVPSDREIARSVNEGASITMSAPRSPAARAFQLLATTFASDPPAQRENMPANGKRRKRRLFRRAAS